MQEFFHQQYQEIWKDSKKFKPMKHNKSPSFFDNASKSSGLKTSIKIPSFKLIPPNFQLKQQIQRSKITPPPSFAVPSCLMLPTTPPVSLSFVTSACCSTVRNNAAKAGCASTWVFPKIGVQHPKLDGFFIGKNPYFLMDDLGGKGTTIFGNHPYLKMIINCICIVFFFCFQAGFWDLLDIKLLMCWRDRQKTMSSRWCGFFSLVRGVTDPWNNPTI